MAYDSKWKTVGEERDGTERMKVRGGWLYRTFVVATGLPTGGLVFVPERDVKKTVRIKRR